MRIWSVNFFKENRAQIKIQQMAFVLVALMIFFAIVSLIYINVRTSNIEEEALDLGSEEAKALVRKMAASPEFSFTAQDCAECIDLDKVLILKDRESYKGFWNLDYLRVDRIYPLFEGECNKINYPNCGSITLIDNKNYGTPAEAFVAICRWEKSEGGYIKCELGKIFATGGLGRSKNE